MSEKITVRQLAAHLLHLVETGNGDKYVELSVNYDHCDHIQKLGEVWHNENFDWVTLRGKKEC